MAEVLRQVERRPSDVERLAFVVLAPPAAIDAGTFAIEMDRGGVEVKDAEATDDSPLPFADEAFDLALNRHSSINCEEVARTSPRAASFSRSRSITCGRKT